MCLVLGRARRRARRGRQSPRRPRRASSRPRGRATTSACATRPASADPLADARGKVIALTFIYATCRDLCPAEGSDISTAMQTVGGTKRRGVHRERRPGRRHPARAQRWLERRGLPGPRQYLIGTRDDCADLAPLRDRADQGHARRGGSPRPSVPTRSSRQPRQAPRAVQERSPTRRRPSRRRRRPAADDAYPDPADLAYRGRARHIAGWDFEHSAYVLLIDKHGEQRLGIPFEALEPESLRREIRVLLAGG